MSAEEKSTDITDLPGPGEFAKDTARGRVGVVLTSSARYVRLRPLAGGKHWDARAASVALLSAREELSARLAVANACRRWGK